MKVRDHSQPCEHYVKLTTQPICGTEVGEGGASIWKCDVYGCPGGREIVLRKTRVLDLNTQRCVPFNEMLDDDVYLVDAAAVDI